MDNKKKIHVKGYDRKRLGKVEKVSAHDKKVSNVKRYRPTTTTPKSKLFTMRMSKNEMIFLGELAHYRGHSIASYIMMLATEDAQNVGVKIPKEAWIRRGHKFTPANKELSNYPLEKDQAFKVYTKDEKEE